MQGALSRVWGLLRTSSGAGVGGAGGVLYGAWLVSGLALCNVCGLLRGRGGKSSSRLSLMSVRFYIFSLMWWPIHQISLPLSTAFLCYLPFYIDLAEFNGWRKSDAVRKGGGVSGRIATFIGNYFNCKLVKTTDIDKQCIVGIHPHGIIPFSGSLKICSEASGFEELFPALKSRVLVAASSCFLVPGFRDLLLSHGVLDCSRFNCEKWIQQGSSLFVFPGGAKEGLYSNPECDWLDLNRRLGFIRLAIRYNIPVVPSYTFNEVDAFEQVSFNLISQNYPLVNLFRQCFQKTIGIAAPFFCHLIPNRAVRKGGTTVMGKPIHLPIHSEYPTDDDVRKCLNIYIQALKKLYDENASEFNSRKRTLIID